MIRSRTKRTHRHGDNRLTFGCAACIDDMRFDQTVAAIADSPTEKLREHVNYYSPSDATDSVWDTRRVIAAIRLELWHRRRQHTNHERDTA